MTVVVSAWHILALVYFVCAAVPATNNTLQYYHDVWNMTVMSMLVSYPVTKTGYLVEWRYLLGHEPGSSCDTYGAVWRKINTTDYSLLQHEKFEPEKPLKKANVVSQFIRNETVQVELGDVMSVYADRMKDPYCQGQLVSSRYNVDGDPIGKLVTAFHPVPHVIGYFNLLAHLPMAVSVQIYETGYHSLGSAPNASHQPVPPGGIRIKWDRFSTNDTDFLLAGYNILCYMQKDVQEGTLIVNTTAHTYVTEVVLSQLPTGHALFARIQLIRLFNGRNAVDKLMSPASDIFCAERSILQSKMINFRESGLLEPGATRKLIVSLRKEVVDNCTKIWTLSVAVTNDLQGRETAFFNSSLIASIDISTDLVYVVVIGVVLLDNHQTDVYNTTFTPIACPAAPVVSLPVLAMVNSVRLTMRQPQHDSSNVTGYQVECLHRHAKVISTGNNTYLVDLMFDIEYRCSAKAIIHGHGYGFSSNIFFMITVPPAVTDVEAQIFDDGLVIVTWTSQVPISPYLLVLPTRRYQIFCKSNNMRENITHETCDNTKYAVLVDFPLGIPYICFITRVLADNISSVSAQFVVDIEGPLTTKFSSVTGDRTKELVGSYRIALGVVTPLLTLAIMCLIGFVVYFRSKKGTRPNEEDKKVKCEDNQYENLIATKEPARDLQMYEMTTASTAAQDYAHPTFPKTP